MPPFPTLGVKLKVFLQFIEDNGGRDAFSKRPIVKEPLTTTDVCNKFVKPITSTKGHSYCELLVERNSPDVGEASVFISHAWKYIFLDVIDSLQHHFSREPDMYIWFDLFSNDQNNSPDLPFEWWKETFMNAISKLGRVVMVISPWNNPIPFTRAWCLWEIYCASVLSCTFEVAITPVQNEAFVQEITSSPKEFYQMLANIDVERSEAFRLAEKERIFNVIESSVGFSKLNDLVIGKMREWVFMAIDENIHQIANRSVKNAQLSGVGIKEAQLKIWGSLLAKMGLLVDMGYNPKACEIGEQCLLDFVDIEDGEKWGKTYNSLGIVYDNLGRYDKAIEYYEKALVVNLETFGPEHPTVGTLYDNLGGVYDLQGLYEKAIECHEKALNISIKALGPEHPEVATSYNNIGLVYKRLNLYDKAIEYYQKSLEIKVKVLGPEHLDMALSYNNLGLVYEEQEEYEKAIDCYEKDLGINLKELGPEHPDVASSYNNLGSVYYTLGQYEKAVEYYQRAFEINVKTLGPEDPDTVQAHENLNTCKIKIDGGIDDVNDDI